MVQQNETWLSRWLSNFLTVNKRRPLKIFVCFILLVFFLWYIIDYPDNEFKISHLIITIVVLGGIFWFYMVKSKKEK